MAVCWFDFLCQKTSKIKIGLEQRPSKRLKHRLCSWKVSLQTRYGLEAASPSSPAGLEVHIPSGERLWARVDVHLQVFWQWTDLDLRALRVENGMLSIQVKDIKSLNKRWRGRWWGSSRRPSGTFRMSLARLPCVQQDFGQPLFSWSAMILWSGGQALYILYTVLIIKQFLMLMLMLCLGTPWAWSPQEHIHFPWNLQESFLGPWS